MKTLRFITPILSIFLLSLLIIACQDYLQIPENNEIPINSRCSTTKATLPFNLNKFNTINRNDTKSSSSDTIIFSLDSSMLNWNNASQINRDNGLVFTQIPFNFNDTPIFAAISDKIETLSKHTVPLKSFYIIAEDCFNNEKMEYIATMIATKKYYEENNEYDFLNMQNYSGIVLYSDSTGTIFKTSSVNQGIINEITLTHTHSPNSTYIGFYNNNAVITKSQEDTGYDLGTLNAIFITADRDNKSGDKIKIGRHPESISQETPEKVVDYTDKPNLGGIMLNEYTLTIIAAGCHNESQTITASQGKSIKVIAENPSDTCIFMHWEYDSDIISNNRTVSVTINNNTCIVAKYIGASSGICFDLAQLASDTLLKANINSLLDSTMRDSFEHGYKLCSNGTKIYGKGTDEYLKYSGNSDQTYTERYHTHPPDSTTFCGGADIWTLYCMVYKNQIREEDIPNFRYGMIAYNTSGFHEVHIIKITDKTKLLQFLNSYDKDTFKKRFETEAFKSHGYDDILLRYTRMLNNMGLSLTRGKFSADYTYNSSAFIRWHKIDYRTENDTTKILINDCKTFN